MAKQDDLAGALTEIARLNLRIAEYVEVSDEAMKLCDVLSRQVDRLRGLAARALELNTLILGGDIQGPRGP